MWWQITQVVGLALIVFGLFVGAGLALYTVGSFINRIGNPYDKW